MMSGRELSQPVDLQFRFLDEESKVLAPKYVVGLQERLIKTHQVMEQRLVREARVAKKYYDSRSNHGSYKRGDLVLLYDPTRKRGLKNKMRALWNGPYVIIKALSSVTYRVGKCRNPNKWKVVHFDKLRNYSPREPTDFGWLDDIQEGGESVEPPDEVQLQVEVEDEGEVGVDDQEVDLGLESTIDTIPDVPVAPVESPQVPSRSSPSPVSTPSRLPVPTSRFRPVESPQVPSRPSTPSRLPVPTSGRRPVRARKQPRHLLDYDTNS